MEINNWKRTSLGLIANADFNQGAIVNMNVFNGTFVMAHTDAMKCIEALLEFYDHHTEAEIIQHNEGMKIPFSNDVTPTPKGEPIASKNKGVVYLMQMGEFYKIGFTRISAQARRVILQSSSPYPIEVLHEIRTSTPEQLERSLHEQFAHKRRNNEWFALSPDEVDYIKGL
jgi:hypothetical protein